MEPHIDLEPASPSPQPPAPPLKKRAGPSISVELLAAVGLLVALLGSLAYFTLSHADDEGALERAAAPVAPTTVPPIAAATAPSFDVFRHPQSNPQQAIALKDNDTVHPSDGFTFALHNHTGKLTHFMIFAMDTSDTLFWFFPQVDPQKQHTSLPLSPIPDAVIPEGVTPGDVQPGAFRVVGLFTSEPVSITEVEDGFRQHGPQGIAEALHGTMQVVALQLSSP